MPGLRGEEFPAEALAEGEKIEYYSRCFVTGDPRGLRVAVILSVDDTPGNELPVSIDTGEPLPLTIFMRRRRDVLGCELNIEHVKWRKLRAYQLEAGKVGRPTMASALCKARSSAVSDAINATMGQLRGEAEHPSGATSVAQCVDQSPSPRVSDCVDAPRVVETDAKRKKKQPKVNQIRVSNVLRVREILLETAKPANRL
ncbi:hypothetical protein GN958_ATG06276 [Phytophthora infestans]|uniref:Uncharacterized protein n=1 Tax=Phytophthora infestans TaxID=4787 RepID=A0A8S9UV15_PHYIN|nr:hypothetical protein GN958_ATG06276 [Phytophthora infestans]